MQCVSCGIALSKGASGQVPWLYVILCAHCWALYQALMQQPVCSTPTPGGM